MLKQLVVATALTCGAAVAFAQTPPSPSPTTPMPRSNTATAPAVESTGDFNKAGEMAGSSIIGAKVRDDAKKETVGSIQDIYLDDSGKVKAVIVSVGGFLGVGAKDVAVKWEDIKYGKDGKSLSLTTSLTKDALRAMPDYKYERQKPASGSGG
jgi:sporulation protein YlmC with PRC-barrel domain